MEDLEEEKEEGEEKDALSEANHHEVEIQEEEQNKDQESTKISCFCLTGVSIAFSS